MKLLKKLGTRRVLRRLGTHDVCVRAIDTMVCGYTLMSVDEMGIGGAAPKNFLTLKTCGRSYVAKRPTRDSVGPRECVTEHLIARIGNQLPTRVANTRLVRLRSAHNEADDVRLMSEYFLRPQEALVHGVELVARAFDLEPRELENEVRRSRRPGGRDDAERNFYTIDLVLDVLRQTSVDELHFQELAAALARMLTLDALVGAHDRHASNWGVIENVRSGTRARFAPVFDTARGLFLRYPDKRLVAECARDRGAFLRSYAERSQPLIGVHKEVDVSHYDLIRCMLLQHGALVAPAVRQMVCGFQIDRCAAMLHREFRRVLSPLRLRLIVDLLQIRHETLQTICGFHP